MFLAIDSVFEQCSVAIVDVEPFDTGLVNKALTNKNLTVLSCQTKLGGREQTQQILPMIDVVLKEAGITLNELTALVFNRGPGAFSGIRINTAVVQALAVAHDLPCVGVSSLAALAQKAYDEHGLTHVYSALDARMKQVYFGEFSLKPTTAASQVELCIMTQVAHTEEKLVSYEASTQHEIALVGNGAELLTAQANQQVFPKVYPDALCVARLGVAEFLNSGGVSAEHALPVYLRHNAWKTLKEQGKKA